MNDWISFFLLLFASSSFILCLAAAAAASSMKRRFRFCGFASDQLNAPRRRRISSSPRRNGPVIPSSPRGLVRYTWKEWQPSFPACHRSNKEKKTGKKRQNLKKKRRHSRPVLHLSHSHAFLWGGGGPWHGLEYLLSIFSNVFALFFVFFLPPWLTDDWLCWRVNDWGLIRRGKKKRNASTLQSDEAISLRRRKENRWTHTHTHTHTQKEKDAKSKCLVVFTTVGGHFGFFSLSLSLLFFCSNKTLVSHRWSSMNQQWATRQPFFFKKKNHSASMIEHFGLISGASRRNSVGTR